MGRNIDEDPKLPPRIYGFAPLVGGDPNTDFILDRLTMHWTPQSNGWHLCVTVYAGSDHAQTKRQSLSGDNLIIPLDLRLTNVTAGQVCRVHVFLDDNYDQVCSNAEDRGVATFTITSNDTKEFRFKTEYNPPAPIGPWYPPIHPHHPDWASAGWAFTLQWHLDRAPSREVTVESTPSVARPRSSVS